MSMFDYVNFSMDCPTCGTKLTDFQSKDKDRILDRLEFWQVRNFYTSCDKCFTWVEFSLKNKKYSIDDYEMIVEKGDDND